MGSWEGCSRGLIYILKSCDETFWLVNSSYCPSQLSCHVINCYFPSADVKLCLPALQSVRQLYKCSRSPKSSLQISGKFRWFFGNHRPGIINSHSLRQVEVTNICQIEERGWKGKPKQKMFSSRAAFLVLCVLFQVAKCSLGKLWLCIIDIQWKLMAIFDQFELSDCVFATKGTRDIRIPHWVRLCARPSVYQYQFFWIVI